MRPIQCSQASRIAFCAAAAAAERVEEEFSALARVKRAVTESTAVADTLKAVESAFSATGLQSFVIESALRQLEQLTASHLSELTENSIRLHLNAFHKKTKGRKMLEDQAESRQAHRAHKKRQGQTETRREEEKRLKGARGPS